MQDERRIRTFTVRDLAQLSEHVDAWDRLAWDAPQGLPLLLPGWVLAYFEHRVTKRERWFCSFAYLDDELVGVLPVIVKPHPVLGRLFPILHAPFDNLTNSGDVILSRGHAASALAALLEEARCAEPRHLGLALPAARGNSPIWRAISGGVPGHVPIRGRTFPFDKIDLTIGSAAYQNQLGSNLRRNLKRYRKKLDAIGEVSVEFLTGPAADESWLQPFLELENSGWKGEAGTSLLQRPSETAFFRSLVRNFAQRQRLEWHLIKLDGRLIAAGLGIRCGGSLVLPRIAFDEDYSAYQPGTLLTGEVNAAAYERTDLFELNHMSAASWHRNWNMPQEDYATLHLVRKGVPAALFHLPSVAGEIMLHQHIKPRIPPDYKTKLKQRLISLGLMPGKT
ncbi:GNAT family N-acetyltransferase [Fulvimarina sp. MAC3]|uniref:GNAT family N-acetyltransferase n=1 Tax=Fulvimarina sp. MAC3 TaxID=3148887 RepID=UPI0031FBEFA3